jgi:glycosyltransferase involved in cell wall biosynthesis
VLRLVVSREGFVPDGSILPGAAGLKQDRYRARSLSAEYAVNAATLAALRLPQGLLCVGYRKSTVRNPLVTIVVPVRNRRATLGRAIDSVLGLADCAAIEIVVVDDGSTDGSSAILKEFDDPRISAMGLLHPHGANTARNVGIAVARAPIIAFLDSDDAYASGRLSEPLYLLACNPDVGIVISSFVACKGQKSRELRLRERIYDGPAFLHMIARYILPPSTSGLTIRRDLLLAGRGFDPKVRRMQDRDLLLRLAPMTKAASSAAVSWRKHWHRDGISSQRSSYYDALCAFVALHPIYSDAELETRNYLIARHVIALFKDGLSSRALEVYRHARTSLSPRIQLLPLLLLSYAITRFRRRRAMASVTLRALMGTAGPDGIHAVARQSTSEVSAARSACR